MSGFLLQDNTTAGDSDTTAEYEEEEDSYEIQILPVKKVQHFNNFN